jgi:Apea-like HEPN
MADLLPVFTTLISDLRTSLPQTDVSLSEVEDLLYEGAAASTAQQIIEVKRRSEKLAEVSDADLWRALTESLVEASKANEKEAATVARDDFEKRLAALASEADRGWLISIPVNADGGGDVAESLATTALRVVVFTTGDEHQMAARFAKACQQFGETLPGATPPLSGQSPALFVVAARGTEQTAVRQAMRSLNVSRDALRFATHLQLGRTDLDPPQHAKDQTFLTDVILLDTAKKNFHTRIVRNVDASLGTVDALNNGKVRTLYDRVARILEACPEDSRKQIDLIWRLARSIRIFSRAVGASNRDLRFLLMVIAFEAVLNRSDAPIAEALSEYGALLTKIGIGDRVDLARELKAAYKVRSLFVHEGRLPSEQLDEEKLLRTSSLVFRTWAETMRRLLPFGEQRLTDKDFFDKLVRLKFGSSFEEAFTS